MNLKSIDLVFTYVDEKENERTIKADIVNGNWNQWGASTDELSENVGVMEAITEAALENGSWVADDE